MFLSLCVRPVIQFLNDRFGILTVGLCHESSGFFIHVCKNFRLVYIIKACKAVNIVH